MLKAIFYHITTGKFIKKSAVFHAQISDKYHEYHIRNVKFSNYDETASVFETQLQLTVL